ncbi:MAG: prolipoprotein diacylglyceryl transferase, partial [Thermoleophilaceae bacterium]|nr:prolipoprotein diacylglyceryl transferase [Thermoleophilaceae bacterium]
LYGLGKRLRKPGALLWTAIALYGAGRFVMFFYRVDSEPLALGLDTTQWISLVLVAVALAGLFLRPALPSLRRLRGAPLALIALTSLAVVMG